MYPRISNPHKLREILKSLFMFLSPTTFPCILNYLGVKEGVFTKSGRDAFYIILETLLNENDEIIVPSFTCNVLLGGIEKAKVKPIFSDVNRMTLNMEYEDVIPLITSNTKAILVTHQFGYSTDIDLLVDLCREKNILIIEDAASAFGAKFRGDKVGKMGDVGFFSFEKSKVISGIEGGLIIGKKDFLDRINKKIIGKVIEDRSFKYIIKSFSDLIIFTPFIYNLILKIWSLFNTKYSNAENLNLDLERYSLENIRVMSKFQKNLLYNQLKNINKIIEIRNKTALFYRNTIEGNFQIISIPQIMTPDRLHTYSRFPILVKEKEKVYQFVKKEGVDLGFTFSYKLPQYYEDIVECKETDFIIESILCIPITNDLKVNKQIIQRVKKGLDLVVKK